MGAEGKVLGSRDDDDFSDEGGELTSEVDDLLSELSERDESYQGTTELDMDGLDEGVPESLCKTGPTCPSCGVWRN